MIKRIILDIDGTITDMKLQISPDTIKVLRIIEEKGVRIDLCSGNVLPVMIGIRNIIGLKGFLAAENGGIILSDNEIRKDFSKDIPIKVLKAMKTKFQITEPLTNRWRETSTAFYYSGNPELVKDYAKEFDVSIQNSKFAYHILNKGQNKGHAVDVFLKLSEIRKDEVLVCGDSENDISMYMEGVHKAALSNSVDILKEKAEFVANKDYGEGVVEVLNHFGLL